jgi:hypothetical protein
MRPTPSPIQDRRAPFWMHHLWSNGYRTAAFSSFADRHNAWWFTAGFEEFYTPVRSKGRETADPIAEPALEWLERNAQSDNWFPACMGRPYPIESPMSGSAFQRRAAASFHRGLSQRNKKACGPRTARHLYPTAIGPLEHHPKRWSRWTTAAHRQR